MRLARRRQAHAPASKLVASYDIQSRPPFPRTAHFLISKGDRTLKVDSCSAFSVERSAYDFSQVQSEVPKFYSEFH